MAKKLEQIPTEKLLAYATILEKLTVVQSQCFNTADDIISRKMGTRTEFEEVLAPLTKSVDTVDNLLLEIQKEIDKRMLADLGLSKGLLFHNNVLQKFDTLMDNLKEKFMNKGKIITNEKPPIKFN